MLCHLPQSMYGNYVPISSTLLRDVGFESSKAENVVSQSPRTYCTVCLLGPFILLVPDMPPPGARVRTVTCHLQSCTVQITA
jgi:hypothetical protein